ncbi:uncharacterized protein LOC132058720 [Lycium ferocissimum]|uniref:uncharacterized protein LOC132058720 n=1 Tax=Lycium ferocissimum TaxID=112874 RepID=UPI002815FEA2|nr:uncharacterized protein LOC132058720 [Lycium ferocissimum]
MAYYYIEEEAWKCPKHPSKNKRRTGVCSICLRDRLSKLCPNCANVRPSCTCTNVHTCSGCTNVRPCSNCAGAAASATSSSSSSKINGGDETALCRSKSVGIPVLRKVTVNSSEQKSTNVRPCSNCAASTTSSSSSAKINGGDETALCRSKSVGIPFLKSRTVNSGERKSTNVRHCSNCANVRTEPSFSRSKSVGIPFLKSRNEKSTKTASFWWIFKSRKRRGKLENELQVKANGVNDKLYCNDTMRSRSVNVAAMTSLSGGNDVSYSPEKLKGWYLLSPMKVFRQSKAPKLVNLK